jgi:hypothetical protein
MVEYTGKQLEAKDNDELNYAVYDKSYSGSSCHP